MNFRQKPRFLSQINSIGLELKSGLILLPMDRHLSVSRGDWIRGRICAACRREASNNHVIAATIFWMMLWG